MGQNQSKPVQPVYLKGHSRSLVILKYLRDESSLYIPNDIQQIIYNYCGNLPSFDIQYIHSKPDTMDNTQYTTPIKLVISGSSIWSHGMDNTAAVGRTSFLKRFTENTFHENYVATLGLDVTEKSEVRTFVLRIEIQVI